MVFFMKRPDGDDVGSKRANQAAEFGQGSVGTRKSPDGDGVESLSTPVSAILDELASHEESGHRPK